jgi:DNA-binding transcriptional LysR family regulator
LDFVFSLTPRSRLSPGVVSIPLFVQTLLLVGLPERLPPGFGLEHLGQTPVVDYFRSDPLIGRWLRHHGAPEQSVRVAIFAATTDLVLELLLRGAGVGVLPDHLAQPWLARGELRVFSPGPEPLSEVVWLNERAEGYRGRALLAFREAVTEQFAASLPPPIQPG